MLVVMNFDAAQPDPKVKWSSPKTSSNCWYLFPPSNPIRLLHTSFYSQRPNNTMTKKSLHKNEVTPSTYSLELLPEHRVMTATGDTVPQSGIPGLSNRGVGSSVQSQDSGYPLLNPSMLITVTQPIIDPDLRLSRVGRF